MNVKLLTILSVTVLGLCCLTGLMAVSDDSDASSVVGSASSPVSSYSGTVLSATSIYIYSGSSFNMTGAMNADTHYFPSSVSSGFGLSINTSSEIVSGTLTGSGTCMIVASEEECVSGDITHFNITVYVCSSEATLTFTNPGTLEAVSGSSFSYTPTANISGTTFSKVSGASWLSILNGVITGTAPTVSTMTNYTATFRATSPGGQTADQNLSFNVYPVLSLSGSSSVSAVAGSAMTSVVISGNISCDMVVSGTLPEGIQFDNGTFSGTPTTAGTHTVQVTATSTVGVSQSATKLVAFYVADALEITSESSVDTITAGCNFSYTVTTSTSATITISGAPSWIGCLDGVITGTAPSSITTNTEVSFTVTATLDVYGIAQTVTQDVSFTVEPVLAWTSVPTASMLIIPVYEYNQDGTPIITAGFIDGIFVSASSGETYTTATFKFIFTGEQADSVLWDFGDGTTSTDWSATHTYDKSGTYTVTCTATNDLGENSTTQDITVDLGEFTILGFIEDYLLYIVGVLVVLVLAYVVLKKSKKRKN